MKNHYFLLRHGENSCQVERPGIVYFWPENNPPCILTKKGEEQIKEVTGKLREKNIDLIYSSDIVRTRQSAEIVAAEIGREIISDQRLRDINWGKFGGGPKEKAYVFFKEVSSPEEKFKRVPEGGESWLDCQKRILDFLNETEQKYQNKNILIVSHGDPLWLLEGAINKMSVGEIIEEITKPTNAKQKCMKVGEVREL